MTRATLKRCHIQPELLLLIRTRKSRGGEREGARMAGGGNGGRKQREKVCGKEGGILCSIAVYSISFYVIISFYAIISLL